MSTEPKIKSETKIHYTQQWVNLNVYKAMVACSRSRPDLDVKVKELVWDDELPLIKIQFNPLLCVMDFGVSFLFGISNLYRSAGSDTGSFNLIN